MVQGSHSMSLNLKKPYYFSKNTDMKKQHGSNINNILSKKRCSRKQQVYMILNAKMITPRIASSQNRSIVDNNKHVQNIMLLPPTSGASLRPKGLQEQARYASPNGNKRSTNNTFDQSTRLIEGISPDENRAAKEYSLN